jgi:hypothetical protein
MSATPVSGRTTPVRPSRATTRALVVAGATFAPVVVWLIVSPLLDVAVEVQRGSASAQKVGVGPVAVTALIASLLGWALLAMLEHRTPRGRTVWTGVAIVALLLSLISPLAAGTTTSAKVVLALMHIAVAAVLIPGLRLSPSTA